MVAELSSWPLQPRQLGTSCWVGGQWYTEGRYLSSSTSGSFSGMGYIFFPGSNEYRTTPTQPCSSSKTMTKPNTPLPKSWRSMVADSQHHHQFPECWPCSYISQIFQNTFSWLQVSGSNFLNRTTWHRLCFPNQSLIERHSNYWWITKNSYPKTNPSIG